MEFDAEAHMADMTRRASLVTVANGCLTIHGPTEYEIELSQIDSHEKILQWVLHLAPKTWVTTEIIRYFVIQAQRQLAPENDSRTGD